MNSLFVSAFAKINLYLDVVGRRSDGYHNIETVMQQISLKDDLTISFGGTSPRSFTGNVSLGIEDTNLCWKAVRCFYQAIGKKPAPIQIDLQKVIPMGAGMGGGSADAAAVLAGLNQQYNFPFTTDELCAIGAEIGSDVPFCVLGGTAYGEGKGEILKSLSSPKSLHFVVCKPEQSVSTPAMYRYLDEYSIAPKHDADHIIHALEAADLSAIAASMYNIFEIPAISFVPEIGTIKQELLEAGALNSMMTGSGSAVIGLFASEEEAGHGYFKLKDKIKDTYLCKSNLI